MLEKNLDPLQFDFVKDKGNQKELLTVVSSHAENPVYMAVLDSTKAFDHVNHYSLFISLMKNSIVLLFLKCQCSLASKAGRSSVLM